MRLGKLPITLQWHDGKLIIATAFSQMRKPRAKNIRSLRGRIEADDTDGQAHLFLGNTLCCDHQLEAARTEWLKVVALDNEPVYVQTAQEMLDRYPDS